MRGSSLVSSRNRVESLPVQSGRYFRGMDNVSSPEIESNRSVMTALSDRPLMRASAMIAADLPIRMLSPNCSPMLASVGPQTLRAPSSRRTTRPIVPLPERFGPTSMAIFWKWVRGVRR